MAMSKLPDQAYLRECFEYHPDTGVLTWKRRPVESFQADARQAHSAAIWNTRFSGKAAGSRNKSSGYIFIDLKGRPWLAHRIIWRLQTGKEVPLIDHVDGDRANNCWTNLRAATNAQNLWNSRGWKGRNLPKGVSTNRRKWKAEVWAHGFRYRLGTFPTIEEAKEAYDGVARYLHGEFVNLGSHITA